MEVSQELSSANCESEILAGVVDESAVLMVEFNGGISNSRFLIYLTEN